MSDLRRRMMSESWTPEMRAAQRAKAEASYQAWAEANPERAALVAKLWADVAEGTMERPGCGECGRPMNPTYDWDALTVVGWRCRRCG
jgi:hypothetical protein